MKSIVLTSLQLKNFKGAEDLTINFSGNTNIFGANGKLKSTLHTAWMWLLTGKDEFDRTDYELKNTKKKELNVQGHEVVGHLVVDGSPVTLKRIYWEIWKKPRGQSQKVFSGHTTEYYYNDVVCNAAEYKSKIDDIIPAKIIKLVTNPSYFNTLDWQDQRRGLIGIAGEISNDAIIDSIATPENDFGDLINVLNGKTFKDLDEWKKSLSSKKSLLKKTASEYEPRIDEAKRNKPEAHNWDELEKEKATIEKEIEKLEKILTDSSEKLSEKQNAINEKSNSLFSKRNELLDIVEKHKRKINEDVNSGTTQITSLESQIRGITTNITRIELEVKSKEESIVKSKEEVERLDKLIAQNRENWEAINKEKFEFDEKSQVCPSCKQHLPKENIANSRTELLKNFNEDVANRKQSEVSKSNISKSEKSDQELKIEKLTTEIIELNNEIEGERSKLEPFETEITKLKAANDNSEKSDASTLVEKAIEKDADAILLKAEIELLETEIVNNKAALTNNSDNDPYKTKKATFQTMLKDIDGKLAVKETIKKTDERIEQLEKEEQENAQAIADIERNEFDIECFNRAKNDLIQKKVNGMFKHVSFRLFQVQVNGEIAETCVCEYEGVPYPTLNTASKMFAGLDVIRTFQQFYGISVPIFCDNRESVTDIPETGAQVISLYVSPEDKKLRVEKA